MSPELLAHIKASEGWVPNPYLDPVGFPTIGYGHRIPDLNRPSITEEQGECLLIQDLVKFESAARSLSPVLDCHPVRLDAIIDFCFNAGITAYKGSTLRSMVNMAMWKPAAFQMGRWIYATNQTTGQKVILQGLVKRRAAMAAWLLTGTR